MPNKEVPPKIDFRVRKINAFLIAITLFAYLALFKYAALILLFHFLDGGWAGSHYSPFSKIANGFLAFKPEGHQWRPAAIYIPRDRLGFLISCLMLPAIASPVQWPFNLLAYGLLALVARDFIGRK
jgi:hypothetical protein